jgi:hypothetical protein
MATISKNGIEPGKLIKSEHLVRIINALAASSSADIKVSGSVSSSLFYGDGRYLSNVTASNLGTLIAAVEPWHVPYLDGNESTFQNSPIHVTSSLVNGVQVFYVAINTTASFEVESRAPEALLVYQDNPDSYTVIRGEGVVDNYFQIDIKNFSTGSSASSDLVATANNGTESDMYVNVGINNQNYAVEGTLGGPNDVYVYGLGQKMVIGNARSGDSGSVTIFAGGFDTEVYKKMFIDPNNNHILTGSLNMSGSLDVKKDVKVSGSLYLLGESLYINGQKQFNYGAFSDTTTQSGSANISSSFKFNTVDFSNNISIANNNDGFPTRITTLYGGIYNLQFSAQISDEGAGDSNIWIWLKKNGQNVPNTATRIYVRHNQETVAAWNLISDAAANDYFELAWQSDDTDVVILAESAAGNIPAIPSIILTITQIS